MKKPPRRVLLVMALLSGIVASSKTGRVGADDSGRLVLEDDRVVWAGTVLESVATDESD
jgi:hypothetical protein